MAGSKICTRCNLPKELPEFSRDRRKADGLRPWCRQCCAEDRKARVASEKRLCSVADCVRKVHANGYCGMHYHHVVRYGVPDIRRRAAPQSLAAACAIDGCSERPEAMDLCGRHYRQAWLVGRQVAAKGCAVEGCDGVAIGRSPGGYCAKHHQRWKRYGDPLKTKRNRPVLCSISGCGQPHHCRGWCEVHYARWRLHGTPEPEGLRAPRGAGHVDGHGYKRHHYRDADGRLHAMLEHRWVMSEILGRPLEKYERVHHKNGNRADNRPQNLELWIIGHPSGQRVEDQVAWAAEILSRYSRVVRRLRRIEEGHDPQLKLAEG